MTISVRFLAVALPLTLTVAACAGGGSSSPSSSSPVPSYEMPTASYSPPADAQVTPPQDILLNSVEPDAGAAPVVDFVNSATKSIDVSTYRIDPSFEPVVSALQQAAGKGIPVRVSVSRQLVGQPNPPDGNASQLQAVQQLQALGLQAAVSRPEFHYGHEKSITIDAGTPNAKSMVSDWNLQQSYFGPNQYGPVGSRGFAVVDTNSADVAMISSYFNANWPPYSAWPVSNRASLLWSPSGVQFSPVGNSVAALTAYVEGAQKTLDIYAEMIQDDSFMLDKVINRAKAGVKVRVIANSSGQSAAVVNRLRQGGAEVVFDPTNAMAPDAVMFVHTKTMVADYGTEKQQGFVGSQNQFINESLEAILELGTIVKDPKSLDQIHQVFETDYSRSTATQASPSPSSSPSTSAGTTGGN